MPTLREPNSSIYASEKCANRTRPNAHASIHPFLEQIGHGTRKESHSLGKGINTFRSILLAIFMTIGTLTWALRTDFGPLRQSKSRVNPASAPSASSSVLEVFQVYPPTSYDPPHAQYATSPLTSSQSINNETGNCQVLLMEHSFGFSYGRPFVGQYSPPKCKFNKVTMNFTVTSRGRQFDRLAIMYLNDTEVYRTSTAEPTFNGIHWEYVKDMSPYLALWKSPQTIIFDLGNLVNDLYTAPFNTTMAATFSFVEEQFEPAQMIIPVSARRGSQSKASLFRLPEDNATNTIRFPRNANRAVFSVSACGQAAEEFWWANVLQSNTDTFKNVTETLYGYSPFREIQVLIDGQLAGVQWPFPVIFTGGVVPGLWRPIVGIEAFDLKEHEIEITPWLPILCDGNEHSFEIRVIGIDDNKESATLTRTVGNSWYVTGKIWIWLDDDSEAVTTGTPPTVLLPEPIIHLSSSTTQTKEGENETLAYAINVKRTLSISSIITTQSGTQLSTWTQNIAVDNYNLFTDFGRAQHTNQYTSGIDQSTGRNFYKTRYQYPLRANTTFSIEPTGNFTLDATLIQGLHLNSQGASVFAASHSIILSTTLNGSAHYFASPKARFSTGFGSTDQIFDYIFQSPKTNTQSISDSSSKTNGSMNNSSDKRMGYHRKVEAVNGTVVKDIERLNNIEVIRSSTLQGVTNPTMGAAGPVLSPRQAIGRGRGEARRLLAQCAHSEDGM